MWGLDRVVPATDRDRAVLVLAGAALAVRLVALGSRVAHFDEGRVAYWARHYLETGEISYRYIVHGPLVQYADAFLFSVLGPSDAVARLPVAIVGGLLPLTALLFRAHLRDEEVVALAAVLAFNPVLLYYSRFLRSTLLVAALLFAAFGALVRAVDTRRVRYVYAAAVLVGLGLAAKENAVVYLLVWIGASALLLDHALFRPHTADSGADLLRRRVTDTIAAVRAPAARPDRLLARVGLHAVGVVLVLLVVGGVLFAPRTGAEGPGLWYALGRPALLPALVDATVTDLRTGFAYWFGGASEPGCHKETLVAAYGCFLGQFLETLALAAAPLSVLAVGGLVLERYATPSPRSLVLFCGYWGLVSVAGYPLGTDIYGAWITVNAIVPLAVPAAVGLGFIYRQGREALDAGERRRAGLVAVVLLLLAGQVGATAVGTSYLRPASASNPLVQYAQPSDDVRPTVERVESAPADGAIDVVLYGETFVAESGSSPIPPACAEMRTTLPLGWYLARADVDVTCAADRRELATLRENGRPAMVVSAASDADPLYATLEGYETERHDLRAPGRETVFFVDTRTNGSVGTA